MKYVVRKVFYDYEKEEKYLNEMSRKGFALTDYSWCRYVFQDAPEGEYIYRIELLEKPLNHPESQKYIKFLEDMGIEHVATYMRWLYMRKKATDGDFDVYSDIASRIQHYQRVRSLFIAIAILNLFIGALNFFLGFVQPINFNSYISIISFSIFALLLFFLIVPLTKKITQLREEKQIRE